jgi:tetratricopeptide (TPR) repeat protein
VEIKPNYAQAHNNLGNVLIVREQADQAIAHYSRAVEIDPEFSEAYSNLGNAEFHRGHFDAAIADYRRVLQIGRGDAVAHNDLANVLAGRGNADEAIMHYGKALEIRPDYEVARRNLALVLSWRERTRKDLAERRNALRLRPNDAALLNDTAWMLATNPNESVRNGTEAVELAQRALRLSGDRDPAVLDTLAAAYAEAGRFPDALDAAQKALALAHGQRKGGLAEKIVSRIALYQGGRPYRDSP